MDTIWIIIVAIIAIVVIAAYMKNIHPSCAQGKTAIRIYHPHYNGDDDYECSLCGCRFNDNRTICPNCDARFSRTDEDPTEYDMEEDERNNL